jgi:hypothetical protein
MRVVHLGEARSGGLTLHLHPNLTVVQGLAGPRREWLLQSLVALVNGRAADVDGLIEAHGVLVDVVPELLRSVLGFGEETIDPVVRSGDLPGHGHGAALADGRRRLAERTLEALRERLDASEGAVADARRRCDVAGRRLAQTHEQAAAADGSGPGRAKAELAARHEVVRSAQVAATEARRRLEALLTDPEVSDRLSAGRARRVAATRALATAMTELEDAGADIDGDAERLLQEAHTSVLQLQKRLGASPSDGALADELRELRAALPDLALRLVRHRSAIGRIPRLEASFSTLQAEEQAAMEQLTRVRTEHTCNQAELRGRLRAADAELTSANMALAAVDRPVEPGDADDGGETPDPGRVQMERRQLVARIDLGGAQAASELLRAEWEAQRRRLVGEAEDEPSGTDELRRSQAEADEDARRKEIEWYLLSRLALQRSVGVAGSVPMILDDTFARLPPGTAPLLLDWLERLASAVQIVVLSDDPQLATWLEGVGPDRAVEVNLGPGRMVER